MVPEALCPRRRPNTRQDSHPVSPHSGDTESQPLDGSHLPQFELTPSQPYDGLYAERHPILDGERDFSQLAASLIHNLRKERRVM
jgi:hypothetical protein